GRAGDIPRLVDGYLRTIGDGSLRKAEADGLKQVNGHGIRSGRGAMGCGCRRGRAEIALDQVRDGYRLHDVRGKTDRTVVSKRAGRRGWRVASRHPIVRGWVGA